MSNIRQDLHTVGINPYAVELVAESVLKSPLAPMTVGKPQAIFFPVQRSDCAGWSGVQFTLEAVREAQEPVVVLTGEKGAPTAWLWRHKKTGAKGVYTEDPATFFNMDAPSEYEWTPLYESPPDQTARIAELERELAQLREDNAALQNNVVIPLRAELAEMRKSSGQAHDVTKLERIAFASTNENQYTAMCKHWFRKGVEAATRNEPPRLTVRLISFPESNGKRNWTALLVREEKWDGLIGNCGGISLARGELWNRVAYEAECARYLIGERSTEPFILDYGDDITTPEQWKGEVSAMGKEKSA